MRPAYPTRPTRRRGLLTAAALLLLAAYVLAGRPGTTAHGAVPAAEDRAPAAGDPPPDSFWGDTGSIPPAQNVLTVRILNRTNGQYPDDQVFWSFNGQTHSIAEQPYLDMPANSAGRMYFHLGSPDSRYSDFIEFTVGADAFHGNTTRVDAFALKLAMRVHGHDGTDRQVGEDYATFQESREATWRKFADAMPPEFASLSEVEAPYRIPSPGHVPDFRPGGQHAGYLSDYARSVGTDATTQEVFGCSGPLAGDAARCAALNRHVAELPQDQWRDPGLFYRQGPANYYAAFWHEHAIDNLAYGFPYDDYAEQSSFVSVHDPRWMVVAVGW
ncbi:glycoside hydrolase family 64 protein [Streptomyces synnematoformans]|uniref:GH64 domain-containing protein n=1 Tax=Streptomyces synnematoformans TaxID=415721 RepID=A0ABP5KAK9_9ACTN